MPELESVIEQKLIEQFSLGGVSIDLTGDYKNRRGFMGQILIHFEQNNKDRLNGETSFGLQSLSK